MFKEALWLFINFMTLGLNFPDGDSFLDGQFKTPSTAWLPLCMQYVILTGIKLYRLSHQHQFVFHCSNIFQQDSERTTQMNLPSGERCSMLFAVSFNNLTMTAPSYMILSAYIFLLATLRSALTFLPFPARCLVLLRQLLSSPNPGELSELLSERSDSEIPQGPVIAVRKVFGRGLIPSRATTAKIWNIHTHKWECKSASAKDFRFKPSKEYLSD